MRRDMIIGRQGDSLLGAVLDTTFSIRSAFGRVRVKTAGITWIHFASGRDTPKDEIWLKTGDHLSGSIEQDRVRFRSEDDERLDIPRDAIHTVIIGAGFGARGPGLR